jgi:hypothetical protein
VCRIEAKSHVAAGGCKVALARQGDAQVNNSLPLLSCKHELSPPRLARRVHEVREYPTALILVDELGQIVTQLCTAATRSFLKIDFSRQRSALSKKKSLATCLADS